MVNNTKLLQFGKLSLGGHLVRIGASGMCMEWWAICDDVAFHPMLVCVHGLEARDKELRKIFNNWNAGIG